MSALLRYQQVFLSVFGLDQNQINSELKYQEVSGWDSLGHMAFMTALEDEFKIEIDIDDIIDFSSYEEGLIILSKYVSDLKK